VDRHDLDGLLAALEDADVDDLVECPLGHLPRAYDCRLHLGDGRVILREDDAFDLAGVEEHEAEYEQKHGDEILPPVSFPIALEQNAHVAECKVIQQIQGHDDDNGSADPDRAGQSPEAEPVVGGLANSDLG
jgi:hypothetical protein